MTHIRQRRDSAANWTTADPVLQLGEVGWETDTRKAKIGDGTTAWTGLAYIVEEGVTSVNGMDGDVTLVKSDIGLGNVDNTPDTAKPVSTIQQAALDDKADLDSPVLTGNPTGPTPAAGDSDTSLATTAFVRGEIDDITPPHLWYYTGDATFAKASYPGLRGVKVRVLGGGGGGGGAAAAASGESSGGAGGSSGGYSEGWIAASALAAAVTVTVGAGGAGASGAAGAAGEDSSFGAHVTALGGPGGAVTASGSVPDVWADSTQALAGTGDLAFPGGVGEGPIRVDGIQMRSGKGGDSHLAGGARGIVDTSSNGAAGSYGAGGSGALSRNGDIARTGGAGGDGIVILELFY